MKRLTPILFLLAALVCALGSVVSAAAEEPIDTVFLTAGGRVRGSIMVDDPSGVTVRLVDGTTRTIVRAQVSRVEYGGDKARAPDSPSSPGAPAATAPPVESGPPPPTGLVPPAPSPAAPAVPAPSATVDARGSLFVETSDPGRVYIDGGERGRAPLQVSDLSEGRHRVQVVFDDGGRPAVHAMITRGQETRIRVELPPSNRVARYRRGLHFGFSAGPTYMYSDRDDASDDEIYTSLSSSERASADYTGLRATGFGNLGLTSLLDVRFGGFLTVAFASEGGYYPMGVFANLRLNVGAVYTAWIGAVGGYGFSPSYKGAPYNCGSPELCEDTLLDSAPFVGGQISLLSFRLGDRRQFEVELNHDITADRYAVVSVNTLMFSYLLLPKRTAEGTP